VDALIVVLAISAGAFMKGVTGSGLPVLAVPVIAGFVGVEEAVVVMAIPGVVTNTWLIWQHREYLRETRDLPALVATGVVGVAAGTWLLTRVDHRVLSVALAGVIGLYLVVFFTRPDFRLGAALTRFTSPPLGLVAGALQGATGVSGPLLATYLHGYRLHQRAYLLAISTLFQVFALVQVVTLSVLHLYTTRRFLLSLLAVVPIMAVLPLGSRLARTMSRRAFDLAVLGVLLLTSGKLLYDAIFA
jgi:uncharacterized protein